MSKEREYGDPSQRPSRPSKNFHLRDLPSFVYDEQRLTGEFRDFVREEVLPILKLAPKRQDAERRRKRAVFHAIHNLVETYLKNGVVSDTRNSHDPGVKVRIEVWDAIESAELLTKCIGSEESGKMTRYRATEKLITMKREWELWFLVNLKLMRVGDAINATSPYSLVYLHSGKIDVATGELLPDDQRKRPINIRDAISRRAQRGPDGQPCPQAVAGGLARLRGIEDVIEQINRVNLQHSWQAFCVDPETGRETIFQPNVCLRQIHVGCLYRAVRLYSWGKLSGQNLSKDVRRRMLIDGEPVCELDFSGMATRMMYHEVGVDPDGDIYKPDAIVPKFYSWRNANEAKRAIVRDFIKRATNVCWNVASRGKANSSVGRLLSQHEESQFLRHVFFTIEGWEDATEIIDRIMAAHPLLHHRFFSEYGIELMTVDGNIMRGILKRFVVECGKPALGIHDAILCKKTDIELARETMISVYQRFNRFSPKIKQEF